MGAVWPLVALASGALLVVNTWLAFGVSPSEDGRGVFIGIALLLDFAGLRVSPLVLRFAGDALKWGTSRLVIPDFPLVLGETAHVRLADVDALRGTSELTAAVRCLVERVTDSLESRGIRQVRRVGVVVEMVHDHRCKVAAADLPFGSGEPARIWMLARRVDESAFLDLSIPLPDGDLGTVLSDGFARYWELEVTADTPGLPFRATFVLPVYARDQTPDSVVPDPVQR